MSFFRKTPLFAGALTLCAAMVVGELWFIYDRWAASRDAAAKLVQRQDELAGMREVVPPPKRDVAARIEADLERAQRVLGTMKEQLEGRGPAVERIRNARAPVARTDAYFDLATFVERTRQLARTQGVEIAPEAARFGFSAYANEAPEADRIESVFEQRLIAQYLMDALIEARPGVLLTVKREPPLTTREREERDAASRPRAEGDEPAEEPVEAFWDSPLEGPDYFTIDPRVSVRAPGYVNTTAFQVVFTGQTAALRQFLNRLASFEVPILVREVQVDPATSEEAAGPAPEEIGAAEADPDVDAASIVLSLEPQAPDRGTAGPSRNAAASPAAKKTAPRPPHIVPIVSRPLSKFTVTMEYVSLVEPQPPPADEAPDAEPPNV